MVRFQVNGNLEVEDGITNFDVFMITVLNVKSYFSSYFGENLMDSIGLYVDNATADSGYTPVTTPVLEEYIIIKLSIYSHYGAPIIAFQFAHELMHFVFYAKYGLKKKKADESEETICTAASLIFLHQKHLEEFNNYDIHVRGLEREGYRNGAILAESINYDFDELIKLV